MDLYSVRGAKPDEQRELTQLCVRATLKAGYDDAFIDRAMPALTITLRSIILGAVQVAEGQSGRVVGVVAVTATGLKGIALLDGLFVDPPFWRRGVGRVLFEAALTRARTLGADSLMIHSEPSAEGFYERLGSTKIGEGPFRFSPDVVLPQLLLNLP